MTFTDTDEVGPAQFQAVSCNAIQPGICVVIKDTEIIYAGPIRECRTPSGVEVLFNPVDFESLRELIIARNTGPLN